MADKAMNVSLDEKVEHIQRVLAELRPAILQDGGDIHFVRFENGTVFVQLHGACVSCPISFITLKMGLETQLKEKVPGVNAVVSVDDE
ncbi:MAG TPA: NifU family protein [Candidatus Babeliales bacterium]|jgi:Fe-S cluster biogenesis protein NfuA|nr:NifU family protein [Candidatus Babeliales bacterium]